MEYDLKAVSEAAQELEGVPWKWRGWNKSEAIDCLYGAFYLLKKGGIVDSTIGGKTYYRRTEGNLATFSVASEYIKKILHVEKVEEQEGAIAIFKNGAFASHIGIITDQGIAHTMRGQKFTTDPIQKWSRYILEFYMPTKSGYKTNPRDVRIPSLRKT